MAVYVAVQHHMEMIMAESVSAHEFATLMAQAGITLLPPAEVEDLRHAHAKLKAMLELLRTPPVALAAEPAFTFSVRSAEASFSRSGESAAQQNLAEK